MEVPLVGEVEDEKITYRCWQCGEKYSYPKNKKWVCEKCYEKNSNKEV